jgi:hypothetical protein
MIDHCCRIEGFGKIFSNPIDFEGIRAEKEAYRGTPDGIAC